MSSSPSGTSRAPKAARLAAALLAAALCCLRGPAAGPAAAAEVWIDVTKAAAKKVALALPPVASPEGPDEKLLREVLENDLLMSGYFRLLPLSQAQLRQAEKERPGGEVDHAAWAGWGAELVLAVDTAQRDGKLVLRAGLHDVGARSRLLAREDRDAASEAVRLAHALADAVITTLTGIPSLAFTRIAAAHSENGEAKRIVVMDYDGRSFRHVSPRGTLALYPAWHPDGERLSYVTYRQGRPEIVTHNIRSGQVRSQAFFPGLNAFPAISPDGKQMLLALSRDGNPEIYRMALDGSELRRLTFSQAVEASPAWSPGQDQIALVSDQGGSPQVYVVGASGGRMRRVSYSGGYATSPDWSPDGRRIVFTAMVEGTFQLFLLDPATGAQGQITFDAEHKENPSWAPDSRHLVYSQGRSANYRLYILDTVSGERTLLTRQKGSFTAPAWSR